MIAPGIASVTVDQTEDPAPSSGAPQAPITQPIAAPVSAPEMVSRRRSLLDYLKKVEFGRYKAIIGELGIRK